MGLNIIKKMPFTRWAENLVKTASSKPEPAYCLSGQLYASDSGWILLSVPNALVHGVFKAMDEPGIELPPSGSGEAQKVNAHISVMRPEEIETIPGGLESITERGKTFGYTIGRLVSVNPAGWEDMAKCWFLKVHSPELRELRRSYGLSALPNDNKYDFHITVAVRRKGVLGKNEKSKAT